MPRKVVMHLLAMTARKVVMRLLAVMPRKVVMPPLAVSNVRRRPLRRRVRPQVSARPTASRAVVALVAAVGQRAEGTIRDFSVFFHDTYGTPLQV